MRRGSDTEDDDEQENTRAPFAVWSLHCVGNANTGIDSAVDRESGEDFGVGGDAGFEDGWREAVEGKSRVTAQVAIEAASNPPEASTENETCKEERETQKQEDVRHLVAELPRAEFACLLDDAVLGLAEVIDSALGKEIESEREASYTIGKDAVMNVATGGVVTSERRRPFPGFAATARVLIVAIGQVSGGR